MSWGMVGAAAISAVGGSIAANKASNAADSSSRAAIEAAELQAQAGREASELFDPFKGIGQQGIDLAGFLGNPQAQADFAQNNPLYQLGLNNLNEQTNKTAASRGRLSSGDTLLQLQNNATLAASPLIDRQRTDILNLLNIGQGVAGNQGNLLTGSAAAGAGGIIGSQNALNAGTQAQINNVGGISSLAGSALDAYLRQPSVNQSSTPPPQGGQLANTADILGALGG